MQPAERFKPMCAKAIGVNCKLYLVLILTSEFHQPTQPRTVDQPNKSGIADFRPATIEHVVDDR